MDLLEITNFMIALCSYLEFQLFQGTISMVERFQSMEENMVQFFNHPPKTSIEINSIQSHIEKEKQLIKSS